MVRYESEFPPFYVTADVVVFTLREGRLCVLMVRRGGEPYAGRLALPGGFAHVDEDLEETAYREMSEEAGIGPGDVRLEQLRTYGAPERDPRYRVVSVAWLALGSDLPDPTAGTDAAEAMWVPVRTVLRPRGELAFDHADILADGLERARAKLEYSGLAVAFCPTEFTVGELRTVYEAVWGETLDPRNFHRKVTGVEGFLEETGERTRRGGGRPAMLYRADAGARLQPPIMRA